MCHVPRPQTFLTLHLTALTEGPNVWQQYTRNTLLVGGLSVEQGATYHTVCRHLLLVDQHAPQLFSSLAVPAEICRRSGHGPLGSEQV